MAQLNVSFDDALLAEVDRLAAERGINRPELLRALVREAIGAEEGWRRGGGAAPVAPEPLLVTTPQFLSSLEQMAWTSTACCATWTGVRCGSAKRWPPARRWMPGPRRNSPA
jgi:hypothetical protein